jgi:hypothetical protein
MKKQITVCLFLGFTGTFAFSQGHPCYSIFSFPTHPVAIHQTLILSHENLTTTIEFLDHQSHKLDTPLYRKQEALV